MATSSNPAIQKLMEEVEKLDPTDSSLEAKLNLIAQKVSAEQRKAKVKAGRVLVDDSALIDPSDQFACDGCQ
ncbi:MAG TPA: hypothetical protein VMB52_02040 [Verrucomicrobiae bacterium]|nr:hypothetical protein [Verrucomicrobiae bacterium]